MEGDKAEGQPRLFSAVFMAIIGIALFSFISGQGLNAGTSAYVDRLGGTATLAGFSAAVFSAAAIAGRLVDGAARDIVFYAAGIFYGPCLGVALPVNQTVAVKNSPSDR